MEKKGVGRIVSAAALFCVCMLCFAATVQAVGHPYNRRGSVAESERLLRAEPETEIDEKAWKKINGVCYNGSGKEIEGAFLRGIDVSEWQDTINWKKVAKSDVDFAIIRISYGIGYMDKTYDYNMTQAIKAGVPVGTYVYSLATTKEMALQEAQLAIRKMKGYKISYPVVYDMEYSKMGELSPREAAELAYVFCQEVKKAGYYPMIYCNVNWYLNKIDWSILDSYDVWLAHFGDRILAPSHEDFRYTIWQSTDGAEENGLNHTRGLIAGIPEACDVDLNFGFKDYTKVITPRTEPLADYTPTPLESVKNGWDTVKGRTYYYVNGKKAVGWKEIDGKYYRFNYTTGVMCKNIFFTEKNNVFRYVGSDGVRYENKWLEKDGKKYYFDENGEAVKGWKEIDGSYYRFHMTTAKMLKNCMITGKDGLKQYVGADGKRYEARWLNFKGQRYRINKYGYAMTGGWKKIGSRYYYFDEKDAYLYKDRRIVTEEGDIYYAGADGSRFSGGFLTLTENAKKYTYYFGKNGKAYKGWHTIDGKKYYFYKGTSANSGTRAESVTLVSSKNVVSEFDENGVCVRQYTKS